jgi:hypothetical protein
MKVRAKTMIYYDDMRRREGEVFELKPIKLVRRDEKTKTETVKLLTPEMQFTEEFMEKVDENVKVRRSKKSVRTDLIPPSAGNARDVNDPRPVESEDSDSVI